MNKLYVIVRNDLEPGLQMAQVIHAAIEWLQWCPTDFRTWYFGENWQHPQSPRGEQNIVVLQVPSEKELLQLVRTLRDDAVHEVDFSAYHEPTLEGLPESGPCGSITAVALYGDDAHRFTSNLPLALRRASRAAPAAPAQASQGVPCSGLADFCTDHAGVCSAAE